jgi:cytochrome P450 family 12
MLWLIFIFQTSSAATGILYCLAKNPDKQEKLREEVLKVMPDKSTPLTAEALNNMPYLRAVVKEGIRY